MKKQTVFVYVLEAIFCEEKYSPYCHGVGASYKAGIKDMLRIALDDVSALFDWLPRLHSDQRGKTLKKLKFALKSFDDTPAAHKRLAKFELEVFGWEATVRTRP